MCWSPRSVAEMMRIRTKTKSTGDESVVDENGVSIFLIKSKHQARVFHIVERKIDTTEFQEPIMK